MVDAVPAIERPSRRKALTLACGVFGSAALASLACGPATSTPPPTPAPATPVAKATAPVEKAPAPAAKATAPIAKTLKKVTMRLDFVATPSHQAHFVALDKGFFAENGLDVEIGDGKGSLVTVQAIGAGTDMIGASRAIPVVQGISNGIPVRSVASWVQRLDASVVFLEKSGIKTPKDLEGKTMVLTPGGAADVIVPHLLRRNGADPDKIKTITGDERTKYTAVAQGQADATTGLASNLTRYSQEYGPQPWGQLAFGQFGVNALDSGLIVHEKTLRDDPAIVRGYLAGVVKAWDFMKKNPEAAPESFQKGRPEAKIDKPSYLAALKWMLDNQHTSRTEGKVVGWAATEDWAETEATAIEAGLVKERKGANQYFTNEFLPSG